ncbi:hypothetical protein [Paenibacillus harenae]|uniref:Uncharacterized protein n=1 Tax=Paenibacillus harenae TaxID=306543 RepID=A0ABT9U4T7_PAEHA|nr:hypothetical protein [Paenibacillus harenae]MDQ0113680.1 hypothetical protein [Paenibacillus harenae]
MINSMSYNMPLSTTARKFMELGQIAMMLQGRLFAYPDAYR